VYKFKLSIPISDDWSDGKANDWSDGKAKCYIPSCRNFLFYRQRGHYL